MRSPINFVVCIALCVGIVSSFGCGPRDMPKEEVADKSKLLSLASDAFKQNKDWAKLSDAEKKPFLDYYKEEAAASEAFRNMQNGIRYFAGSGPTPPPTKN